MKKSRLNRLRLRLRLSFKGILILTLALTFLTFLTFVAFAGIATTKHNMSTTGGPTYYATSETQICVFCHTPHSASKAVDGAPLWNHSISSATYSVRDQAWTDLNPQPWRVTIAGQPDRSSKLCLGCHDGTVALGLLVNIPGPGMGGTVAGLESPLPCGPSDYSCLGTNFVSSFKHLDSFGFGDHLISMEYNAALAAAVQALCPPNGSVSVPIIDPANIPSTNPVKLYKTTHLYPSGTGEAMGVQCRSCHDPHEDTSPRKCFLVNAPVPSRPDVPPLTTQIDCTACPCPIGGNYDALCLTCHLNSCP